MGCLSFFPNIIYGTPSYCQIDSGWVSVVGYDRLIYTGKWETSLDEDALREYFNNVENVKTESEYFDKLQQMANEPEPDKIYLDDYNSAKEMGVYDE